MWFIVMATKALRNGYDELFFACKKFSPRPYYERYFACSSKNATKSIVRTSNISGFSGPTIFKRLSTMDRRFFLKTSGIGLASFGLMSVAPDFLHQFAAAQ